MNIQLLDGILIGIVLFFSYVGYRKGLILSLLKLVAYYISYVLARVFAPMLSHTLAKTALYDTVDIWVKRRLEKIDIGEAFSAAISQQNSTGKIDEGIVARLLKKGLEEGSLTEQTNQLDFLRDALLQSFFYVVAFLLVFFGTLILLSIGLLFIKKVLSLPGLKQIDRTGGFLLGALQGALVTYLLMFVVVVFGVGESVFVVKDTFLAKHYMQFIPLKTVFTTQG